MGTNTPPWDSNWAWARVGATKHAMGVLKMDGGRKRELGKDVGKHAISRAPNNADRGFLYQIADVMVLDVNVLGLRGGHGVW